MKWITELTLNNYRAFGKPEVITIPNEHHLLIYGENGSGKSSIYNAVKDFFGSSFLPTTVNFQLNKFQEKSGNTTGEISVNINDAGTYNFALPDAGSNHRNPVVQLAKKVNGFLDYKRMLQAHSLDIPDGKRPNVFKLIIKELLKEHIIPNPKGGTTTVELLEEYNRLLEVLLTNNSNSNKFNVAQLELASLQSSLESLLKGVIKITNDYLKKYFNNKLELNIQITDLGVAWTGKPQKKIVIEELFLKIKYAGEEINYYQAFLNEARLSSLAICLYLASIKSYKAPPDILKVIYLDDVFIGLDTSNRFPLLEIIKNEFIDHNFQVFISTYDREWFELSRHWFTTQNCKIKSLELFIEDDDDPTVPDYPVVIPSEGNFAKAEAYFKSKDYPAAGNYLRKECEFLIKERLPKTYRVDDYGQEIDSFEKLLNQLEKLFDDFSVPKPKELLDSIKIYRKALLNPSSHSDLKSPLFRREIKDAFEIIDKLKSLPKMKPLELFEKGAVFTYRNDSENYTVEIELADNLFVIEYDSVKTFSKHKFKVKKWTWNTHDFAMNALGTIMNEDERIAFCEQKRTLEEVFKPICHTLAIKQPANLNSEILIGTGGTLNDLLK